MIKHRASESFTQKSTPVHYIRTETDEGDHCYFFLRASEAQIRRLRLSKDEVDIADFGEILASGYGDEPSDYVRKLLKDRYNIALPN